MIIAYPWTRGGYVCAQVCEHTSPLHCLETFLDRKFGKTVREENISPWRRTVCGDLTAAFSRYEAPKAERLPFLPRRSEEHTSELQSLMRISYAVFCLKKKKRIIIKT